jgi:hypothetical protein
VKNSITNIVYITSIITIFVCCSKKNKCEDGPFYSGYIIGFDPCTAFSSGNKGYVIKFENTSDTIVAYFKLPDNIVIPDSLFNDYRDNFLFPIGFRNLYQIRANYREAKPSEMVLILCRSDIIVADFQSATKGKQTIIDCFEQ